MKTNYMILSAAIPLLSACASNQQTPDHNAWNIKPVYSVRHSTETPTSYYQLGRYYQGQNRYEQALSAYQKALEIDSTFVEARNGLGVIYAKQGKLQDALEQFNLAVKQAPNATHIRNNLGYALYLSRSYAAAASELEQAVALEPSNQSARINLALALDKAGERDAAVHVIAQAVQPKPVENVPLVSQEFQRLQTASLPEPVVASTPIPVLPKEQNVIAQTEQKPLVESRLQTSPAAFNVAEPQEQKVHGQTLAGSSAPVSVQPKVADIPMVQAAPKPAPALEIQARTEKQGQAVADKLVIPAVAKSYRIEVSNGNGVAGFARKVASFLSEDGYMGARLTNQKSFQVAASQVHYRAGYKEQAQLLAQALPGQPGIALANDLRRDISVRVVLGKDIEGNLAYFESGHGKVRLALH